MIGRYNHDLTARQQEVIVYILQGYSRLEIGDSLSIAPNTVKNHTTEIMAKYRAKYGARNMIHVATLYADGEGLDARDTIDLSQIGEVQ